MVGGTCFGGVCGPAPTVEGTRGLFFDGVSVMAMSSDKSYRTCICRSPEVCGGYDGWLQVPGKIDIPGSNVTMVSSPAVAGESFTLTLSTTVQDPVYAWAATLVPAPSLCTAGVDFDVSLTESSATAATFFVSPVDETTTTTTTTAGNSTENATPTSAPVPTTAGLWHVCVCLTFIVPNEAGDLPPCDDFTLAGSVDVRPKPESYALHGAVVASGLDPEVWVVTGGNTLTFSVLGASPDASVAAT